MRAALSEKEAEQSAEHAEENALRQQLPHQPHPSRAQRAAHGEFTRACRAPGEQQAGHIRADNQQHDRDNRHQDHKRSPELLAQVGPSGVSGQ